MTTEDQIMFIAFVLGREVNTLCRDPARLITAANTLVTDGVIPSVTIMFRSPGEQDRVFYRISRISGGGILAEKSDDADSLLEQAIAIQAGA